MITVLQIAFLIIIRSFLHQMFSKLKSYNVIIADSRRVIHWISEISYRRRRRYRRKSLSGH